MYELQQTLVKNGQTVRSNNNKPKVFFKIENKIFNIYFNFNAIKEAVVVLFKTIQIL